jgi:hypothetical protein
MKNEGAPSSLDGIGVTPFPLHLFVGETLGPDRWSGNFWVSMLTSFLKAGLVFGGPCLMRCDGGMMSDFVSDMGFTGCNVPSSWHHEANPSLSFGPTPSTWWD